MVCRIDQVDSKLVYHQRREEITTLMYDLTKFTERCISTSKIITTLLQAFIILINSSTLVV